MGKCSGLIPFTLPEPFVDNIAAKKVPAAILSPIISWSVGLSLSTPSTIISLVPAPLILAPIFINMLTISTISGSLAAFSMTVMPLANTAASKVFSVAPTDAYGRFISTPLRPSVFPIKTP